MEGKHYLLCIMLFFVIRYNTIFKMVEVYRNINVGVPRR